MNALDFLFEINRIEGKLTQELINYRLELGKIHGNINMHYMAWEPDGGHPFNLNAKIELHQRVKSLRRAISELLQECRMDKKYG